MQFPKVVDEWDTKDRDGYRDYDGLPAWATVTIAAVLGV